MSKYFKLPDRKEIIEVKDENTVNVYLREGFVEVDAKGKPINTQAVDGEQTE